MGENGCGKSTLLEAMAVAWGFNPEGGSRNFSFTTRSSHSSLHQYLTLVKTGAHPRTGYFFRAESYFNVATEIERLDEGGTPPDAVIHAYGSISLHEQSHGESFLALIQHRFFPGGLYLLDEPEAALSPAGLLKMLAKIDQLVKEGSQFIIATHSPVLMALPGALVYEFRDGAFHETDYQETSHFRFMKQFMNNPHGIMGELTGSK
jgi:predicted ATPase